MIKVIVFDFDGTLIDSNQLKYGVFFDLFPRDKIHHKIITEVMDIFLEESRYVILEEILRRIGGKYQDEPVRKMAVADLATEYNDRVTSGAKRCKEKPWASHILSSLSKQYKLYVMSTTPENSLREIIQDRNWSVYFCDIFGYPKKKSEALHEIRIRERVSSDTIMVVGDGTFDRDAAFICKCNFFSIDEEHDLKDLLYCCYGATSSRS